MDNDRRRRLLLLLILTAYSLITLGYSVINPLFEAPDEHFHFFTVKSVVDNGRLPVVDEEYDELLGPEAAQPPLYYVLGAALIVPLDTDGAREDIWFNPFAWIGDASALTNINRVVHTPAEAWPWQGYPLAAHVLRLFSLLLGLGTLLAIYRAGRLLWPDDDAKPLLATALVAFLPQFNFIHGSITNDALITFLASAALAQLIWLWQRLAPGEPPPQRLWLRLLVLGLTIGLAALSKTAGILLLVYSLGFLFVLALRHRDRRLAAQAAVLVGGMAVAVAGWLWLRNWNLYGDVTAANQFVRIAGGDRSYTLGQVLGESGGLSQSLVAVFGWFNVRPPDWIFWVWAAIGLVAVIGGLSCLALRLSNGRQPSSGGLLKWPGLLPLLLAGWVPAVYAGLAAFMLRTEAAQGRLLFPAILPLALGIAWGWLGSGACRERGLQAVTGRMAVLPVTAALVTTVYGLLFVIRPAYALPQQVAAIPESAVEVLPDLRDRGLGVSLLAAEVESEAVEPGDPVRLTLYWQTGDVAGTPEFVMEVFGRELDRLSHYHGYHGGGQYPATLWPEGVIIADQFAVRVDEGATAPVLARIFAHVAEGAPGIEVGTVKVVPARWPAPPDAWQAEFGDHIALVDVGIVPEQARPGDELVLNVRWYVPRGRPDTNYTTLIHLGQPDQPPLATGDNPPLGGDYPTGAWDTGETIDDAYVLQIPAGLESGRHPIWIGLYDATTGERLPVTVNDERQPNDVYLAGWVEIGEEVTTD